MLKKMLSVFLCLTLAVTTVMVAPLTSAGAVTAKQWVQDFENYDGTNVTANGMEVVDFPAELAQIAGGSGGKALHLSGSASKMQYLFPDDETAMLEADKTYTVSYYAYVVSTTAELQLALKASSLYNKAWDKDVSFPTVSGSAIRISSSQTGQWVHVSKEFTGYSGYLVISSWPTDNQTAEFYIDDFTVTEVPDSVTVTYVSGTSEAIAADTGAPGDELTLPTPTENIPGYVFGGWADESGQLYSKTVYPSTDLTLTAVWAEPQAWTQDFENYNPTNVSISHNTMELVTLPDTVPVRTGSSGRMAMKATINKGETKFVCLFPGDDTAIFAAGKTYTVSCWVYVAQKDTASCNLVLRGLTVNNQGYEDGYKVLHNELPSVVGEWKNLSYTFTPDRDSYLSFSSNVWGDGKLEFYIDDFTVTERPATVAISYVSSTGETPDSAVGAPGDSVTHPTPSIEKAGYSFVGWYDADGNACTVYPNSNITLFAAWSRDVWTQDFSSYDGTGIGANGMEVVDLPAELPQKEGASGGKALHYSGDAVKFQYLFPGNAQAKLEAEKKYIIAYDVYVANATDTVQLTIKASSTYGAAWTQDQVVVPDSYYFIQASDAGRWIHVYRETTGVAGYLSITNYMKGVTGEFYVDDFTVTEIIDLETAKENKAAIRLAGNTEGGVGKQGLRVYNKINSSLTANKTIVEYGTLAIRYGRVAPNTVIDVNTAGIVKGVAYDSAAGINKVWSKDPDGIVFTAYLTGIKTKFYGADYAVRTYAKDSDGNYYYGDQFTLCVYDVVAAIQASDSASAADTETAETIIAEDPTAYTQWMNKQ